MSVDTSNLPQKVEYLPIKEIDFTSAHVKKRKLDGYVKDAVDSEVPPDDEIMTSERSVKGGTHSTEFEFLLLFNSLSLGDTVLSVIPKKICTKTNEQEFFSTFDIAERNKICGDGVPQIVGGMSISVTQEMANSVEVTRDQSRSRLWFKNNYSF